ncbi:hypothetical protein LJC26_01205 [Desulfovibrio sp. OttesenSCG-928-O18]|nr:hypothetical protein [Desulfovibrio sp. OttesenSCG-928-O18]
MKIQNEQLQALQQQAEVKAKQRQQGVFDAILSEELGTPASSTQLASGQAAAPTAGLFGLAGVNAASGVQATPEATALAAVAESIDAMLSGLDDYAETLSSSGEADLRKAYGILQNMDKNLAALRESSPDLATRHAGMASLVDEISVITRAETVKLNRGDYL